MKLKPFIELLQRTTKSHYTKLLMKDRMLMGCYSIDDDSDIGLHYILYIPEAEAYNDPFYDMTAILDVKEIVVFGSIIVGACLGFLIFNLNTAKVFMGDTGSLLLGGTISAMALYLKMPLLLLIIAAVPVLETISVVLQVAYFKMTKGKRLFKMAPIHHHFELSGWKENKVVSVFCIVTFMFCIIGLYSIL